MIASETNTKAQRDCMRLNAHKQTSARTELKLDVVHHMDRDRTPGFSVIDLGDSEILRGQNGWNVVLTQTAEVLIRQNCRTSLPNTCIPPQFDVDHPIMFGPIVSKF